MRRIVCALLASAVTSAAACSLPGPLSYAEIDAGPLPPPADAAPARPDAVIIPSIDAPTIPTIDAPPGTPDAAPPPPMPDAATPPDAGVTNLPICGAQSGTFCSTFPKAATSTKNGTAAADFTCNPPVAMTTDHAVNVSGTVKDFQTMSAVSGATVTLYLNSLDLTDSVATTTSDVSGHYTLTVPAGAPNYLNWRSSHSTDSFDTYEVNLPIDLSANTTNQDHMLVSKATINSVALLLGQQVPQGVGVVVGTMVDCGSAPVQHTEAFFSSTSSAGNSGPTQVSGTKTYYFNAGNPALPTTNQPDTNSNGMFVVIDTPPGPEFYVQDWGFLTSSDVSAGQNGIKLLSEFAAPSIPNAVVAITLNANQGPY